MQQTMRPSMRLGLRFASAAPLALCPCEGGVLELSGVFGGKSSLTRSSAFSFRNLAAETIYRFAFVRCTAARVQRRPASGNYVFRPGGHVTSSTSGW